MNTVPPKNYRRFNPQRFIKKFQNGGEPLLSAFFRKHLPESDLAKAEPLKTDGVLEFLEKKEDAGKEVTKLLYFAYDLGDQQGAFFLRIAARNAKINPDPESKLIPEHLSLSILIGWPEVFSAAYDRLGLAKTDNFSFYAGKKPFAITDPAQLAESFATHLRNMKKSPKVVVRSFIEEEMVNLIFYHEKNPSAPLVINDTLAISTLWHRPAQQDFVCYNTKTGHVECEIGSRGEQASIRKLFATACTGDAEFFDQPGSTDFLALDKLLDPTFSLNSGIATVTRLLIRMDQKEEPSFEIESEDVFATLDQNELRPKFQGAKVEAATLELAIAGVRRRTLIRLSAPNKVAFPCSMHTAAIFEKLRSIALMKP